MSVPEGKRGEGKFAVLVNAQMLCIYTIKICTNKNVFLPEYQNALTDDIIRTAKNIFIDCWTANNIRITKENENEADRQRNDERKKMRRRLQERAMLNCNNLLALMQIAQLLFHLKLKRIKYWGGRTLETRAMIKAWMESDLKRYSKE